MRRTFNMPKKHTYKFIKEQIESENGYKLLSKEYIDSKTKLKIQCSKVHIYKTAWTNFQIGYRCPICSDRRLTYEYIKEQIESKDSYKLISEEYINNNTKLEVRCSKGHQYKVTWANFRRGRGCPYCDGRAYISYEFIKKQMKKEGYTLLSEEYINSSTKLEVQCNKGHIYKVNWNNFQRGKKCPVCDRIKTSSKGEKEVCDIVKVFTKELIIENDRTQIINPLTGHKLELDIWIPSLNKAIEYNGTYWHSLSDRIEKDKEKERQCKEKGIDLLVIKEEDWQDCRNLCEMRIYKFVNKGV